MQTVKKAFAGVGTVVVLTLGYLGTTGAVAMHKSQKEQSQKSAQIAAKMETKQMAIEDFVDRDSDGIYEDEEVRQFLDALGYEHPIFPGTQFEIYNHVAEKCAGFSPVCAPYEVRTKSGVPTIYVPFSDVENLGI